MMHRTLVKFVFALCFAFTSTLVLADDTADFFNAVSRNDPSTVFDLIWHGVNPNIKEPERGDTALIVALRDHAMRVFDVLLKMPKIDLDASSNNGDTALMIASYTGNLPAVQALLDKDIEVNRHGWTALHYASSIGNCDIIKLLLEKSAYIDAEAPNKTTPVMMAARSGQTDAVKLLVEEGADITIKNDKGMTAADFALKNDHAALAEWLTNAHK